MAKNRDKMATEAVEYQYAEQCNDKRCDNGGQRRSVATFSGKVNRTPRPGDRGRPRVPGNYGKSYNENRQIHHNNNRYPGINPHMIPIK